MALGCGRSFLSLLVVVAVVDVTWLPNGSFALGPASAMAAVKKKAKEKKPKADKKDKSGKRDAKNAVLPASPATEPAPIDNAAAPPPADTSAEPVEAGSSGGESKAAAPADVDAAGKSTAELLGRAKELYGMLEYADVIPLAEAVLAREDANIEQRLDAYLLQGSSLAIVGDSVEAEKPFRFLLRGRPNFEMPVETPPKILAVFRKVQVEEKAIANQLKDLARQNSIKSIELKSEVPAEGQGGVPLTFEYRLKDPRGAVATMNIHYRKSAAEPYSSLALKVNDEGMWTGDLPGEYTENEGGLALQYYLTTKDIENIDLVTLGGPSSPLSIALAEGAVADAKPFYKSWWFWTATGVAVVAMGVGGWFGYDNYRQSKEPPSTSGRIDLKE